LVKEENLKGKKLKKVMELKILLTLCDDENLEAVKTA